MRALVTWWGVSAVLAVGYALGHAGVTASGAVAVAVCACWAGAATVLVAVQRRGLPFREGQRATAPLVVAALALASAHGLEAGRTARDAGAVPATAIQGPGVVWVRVQGASRPGGRCRFLARPRGGGPRLWISTPPEICPASDGQWIALLGSKVARMTTGPGQGDPGIRARVRGAAWALEAKVAWHGEVEGPDAFTGPSATYWRAVASVRQHAWHQTRGDDAGAFVAASVLGLPEALPPRRRRALRRAGVGHLIAVSGLHIGVVALVVHAVALRVVTLVKWPLLCSTLLSLTVVIAFVGLTGAAAPAVRAAVMVAVAGAGTILGRPVHGPTLLGVAVAGMLVVRPAWSLDPGFHLSVVAMMVLVTGPRRTFVGQTWAVSWGVLPVTLLHFGSASLYAVVSNLALVPLFTGWVLPMGAMGWLASPLVGEEALAPARLGAEVVLDIAGAVASWPLPGERGIAMLGGVWALVSSVAARRHAWRRWVPRVPVWVALALIVAVSLRREGSAPPGTTWFALGEGRRPSLLVHDDAGACLIDPKGPAAAWPERLRALGVQSVAGFAGPTGGRPDLVDLQQELSSAGLWHPGPADSCRLAASRVPPSDVARLRKRCRERFGTAVAVARTATGSYCYDDGRFRAMISSSMNGAEEGELD